MAHKNKRLLRKDEVVSAQKETVPEPEHVLSQMVLLLGCCPGLCSFQGDEMTRLSEVLVQSKEAMLKIHVVIEILQ